MKIYLIVGSTGIFDDYREWRVCAYVQRNDAELHLQLANDWAKDNYVSKWPYFTDAVSPYDPFYYSNGLVTYEIEEVELRHEVDFGS